MDNEAALREIVSILLISPPHERNLRRIVATVCKKYRLSCVPRNSDILACARTDEREFLLPILRVKPSRTLSGVAPVAVMTSPAPCPHGICLPCPGGPDHPYKSPQSYTGEEPAARRAIMHNFDPYDQTAARLHQFEQLGHHVDKAELIVMGGTMTARDEVYQQWFVSECIRAMNDHQPPDKKSETQDNEGEHPHDIPEDLLIHIREPEERPPSYYEYLAVANEEAPVRCVAITFETRPDWCKQEHINRMLDIGVTKVEMGVQHLDNSILELNRRGCTVEDTITANTLLRDAGLKVGFHIMPNLPGSTLDADREVFKKLFLEPGFKPDFLKIYPTLVTPGAEIEEMLLRGEYTTYPEEDLIALVADAKTCIDEYCRLQRIQRDIPADRIISGSRHSNFRELAKSHMNKRGMVCRCIRCREIGRRHSDDEVILKTYRYDCCKGEERFINYGAGDSLIGFARLRFPGNTWRPETDGAAFVRELHVYGMVVPLGKSGEGEDHQHRKLGKELLAEAERQAADEGFSRVAIMAGIGVRPYYRRLGYERSGPYMIRDL
ncbi:MAG TPA: tRNA uridine(34) 5-carboxymethylaminomethyl modification radical SAM/GNAT enzyme Elp3 [Methanospirillum sp.]|nr:tRNA uridine(34) 5-carboxymethylaminomethyl modification radical SAM/GNAT enzyme Elp3 [Methanospirillum sp.]